MISNIIHQTAPTNKNYWHPLWHRCKDSWELNFPNFEYRLWGDEEIDKLVKDHYPKYWEMYNEFPVHIMKIDFVRFCFLHKFGGIYADMDVFCYKNFYDELDQNIYVLENPMGNDAIENSMMASEAGHPFWIECMDLCFDRYYEVKQKGKRFLEGTKIMSVGEKARMLRPFLVFYITGTNLISTAARITKEEIYSLPGIFYNNNDMSYHPEYRTKHVHTGLWGKENIMLDESHEKFKSIPIDNFDFYTDYTNGRYIKDNVFDLEKNDSYGQLAVGFNYEYK